MTLDSLLQLQPLAASQSRTEGCSPASVLLDDGTLLPKPLQLRWEQTGTHAAATPIKDMSLD